MNSRELKAARVKKDYNQSEVAEYLNIALKTYSRKETGKVPFTPEEIVRLANLLDLSLKEIDVIFFDSRLAHVLNNEQAATKESA